MKFFVAMALMVLTQAAQEQHGADKALLKLKTLIESGAEKSQVDTFFMEPSASLDFQKLLQIIERLESHKIEEVVEGPVVFYPLNEASLYMIETKEGWKFAPSASRHFDEIYNTAFRLSSPQKTVEFFQQSIVEQDYNSALSCIVRGKVNFKNEEGELTKEAEFALENFAVFLQSNPLESMQTSSYEVDVLRTYNSDLGEINFVLDRGDWLITSSTSKNLIRDHFGQEKVNDLTEALPEGFSSFILMLRKVQWLYIIVVLVVGF